MYFKTDTKSRKANLSSQGILDNGAIDNKIKKEVEIDGEQKEESNMEDRSADEVIKVD
jgi:hypothetical protein